MNSKRNVILIISVLTAGAGCASASPSAAGSIQETKELLASPEGEELQHEYPRLFEDANDAVESAEKAYEDGKFEDTELYTSIAKAKYESAKNLSMANEYNARRSAMAAAAYNLTDELAGMRQEKEVIDRYKKLDERFKDATSELDRYRGDDKKARAAIAEARRMQGRAIKAGAVTAAPNTYQEGEEYIERALRQLEAGSPKASYVLAERAIKSFDAAIDKAQSSEVARRRAEEEHAKDKVAAEVGKKKAQEAIDLAVTTRSKAIEVGAESKAVETFNAADYRLDQARNALENGRYERSAELAGRATEGYKKAIDQAKGLVEKDEVEDVDKVADREEEEEVLTSKKKDREEEAEPKGDGEDEFQEALDSFFASGERDRAKEKKRRKSKKKKTSKRGYDDRYDILHAIDDFESDSVDEDEDESESKTYRRRHKRRHRAKSDCEYKRYSCGSEERSCESFQPFGQCGQQPGSPYGPLQGRPNMYSPYQQPVQQPYPGYPQQGVYPQPYPYPYPPQGQMPPVYSPSPYQMPFYGQGGVQGQGGYQVPGGYQGVYGQPPQPQQSQAPSATPAERPGDELLRNRIIEKLSDAQLRRADLYGANYGPSCDAAVVEQIDAIINIVKERLATKDYTIALEFLTRADERLRECSRPQRLQPLGSAPAPQTQSAPQQVAAQQAAPQQVQTPAEAPKAQPEPKREERKEEEDLLQKTARASAVSAINQAAVDIARAKLSLNRDPVRIEAAQRLLTHAQNLYQQERYTEATVAATHASDVINYVPRPRAQEEDSTPQTDSEEAEAQEQKKEEEEQVRQHPAAQQTQVYQQRQPVVPVDDVVPQCQANASLVQIVREKQSQVATPENVNTLIQGANDLNAAGRCADAALFYQQALTQLFNMTAVRPAPAVMAQQKPEKEEKVDEDQLLKSKATIAIADAEEKRAAKARFEKDPSYQVGLRLLSSARDRFREGNYPASLMMAKEAAGSFDNVVETEPEPEKKEVAPEQAQQSTAALEQDPRQYRREYNQVLDALVARDRARDRVTESTQETFDRGLDFLSKSRRAWTAQDYQGAGKLAVEAKKEFDSIQKPEPQPVAKAAPEPKPQPTQQVDPKKKQALQLLEVARKTRRDCEAVSCRTRDDRTYLDAVGRVVDAETAFATEQLDATITAAQDAINKFKKLMAMPKPIQSSSPYLSINGDQLMLNPRITFDTGSANISADAIASVEAAADFFKEFGDRILSITVAGYTDSVGNAGKNQRLSANRADSVVKALKARGVTIQMNAVGYGENNPIASNKTADGREQNRRVEIRFKSQEKK